ncbi:MAG: SpoIIE family protein phosphatase [Bacteroidales bacterium]|nr:SpoIIE family protein phosphatase [Bacteroidales bacterium]
MKTLLYIIFSLVVLLVACSNPNNNSSGRDKAMIEYNSMMELYDHRISRGDYQGAFEYANRANRLADSLGNARDLAYTYTCIAFISAKMNNFSIASKNYYLAYQNYLPLSDSVSFARLWREWGRSSYENGVYDSAAVFFQRAFEMDSLVADNFGLKSDLIYQGHMFLNIYRSNPASPNHDLLVSAYNNFLRARDYGVHTSETEIHNYLTTGLCEVFFLLSESERRNKGKNCCSYADSCMNYYPNALKIIQRSGNFDDLVRFDLMKVRLKLTQKDVKGAEYLADSLYKHAQHEILTYHHEAAMTAYAMIAIFKGEYKKAVEHFVEADDYKISNASYGQGYNLTQQLARGQMESEQMKAFGREQALAGKNRAKRMIIIVAFTVITFLVVILIMSVRHARRYKKLNKIITVQNEEIKAKNEEITAYNEEISAYNQEITESINYASRIQQAVLPSKDDMKKLFGDNLLIYSPRNIVSGDFFWALSFGGLKFIVAGDCTGHGVPGALLSMLGMSCLDSITRNLNLENVSAGEILDKMRIILKGTLKHDSYDDSKTNDAIDLALVIIDAHNMKLQFSGAYRPLVIIRSDEILRTKGDNMPIGAHIIEKEHFTNHVLDIQSDDMIYLFSDGLTDQFGYRSAKRPSEVFNMTQFCKLLLEVHKEDFQTQKQKILQRIDEWKKPKQIHQQYCIQTDDNLLIGLSVKNICALEKD